MMFRLGNRRSEIHLLLFQLDGKSEMRKGADTRWRDKGEPSMNSKLKSLCLSSSLALSFLMIKPVTADEWNKRTEFRFSAPVEIPGTVLAPGEYVFQVADSTPDRNIVRVFSDSGGKESLVATIMAIPDYVTETPDKPIIHFEEPHSGTPETIHSWFYPGDNTGWEFVYPKGHTLEASTKTTAAPLQ